MDKLNEMTHYRIRKILQAPLFSEKFIDSTIRCNDYLVNNKIYDIEGITNSVIALYVIGCIENMRINLCYGLCEFLSQNQFFHVWIEANAHIIDLTITSMVNNVFSNYGIKLITPFIDIRYENNNIIDYHPYTFQENWQYHYITTYQGKSVCDYIKDYPKVWEIVEIIYNEKLSEKKKEEYLTILKDRII